MMAAARFPARSEPANNQFFLPVAQGLIWFSTQLCRLSDYAASFMRVAVGMVFHDRCVGINI
jgi:hypothetical protein